MPQINKNKDIECCRSEDDTPKSLVIIGNAGTMMSKQKANQQTMGISIIRLAKGLFNHFEDIIISIPFRPLQCKSFDLLYSILSRWHLELGQSGMPK